MCSLLACAGCSGGNGSTPDWQQAFEASEIGWLLNVWGPSADDLYAVGGRPDTADESSRGVLMHYDGTAWEEQDPGIDVPLLNWIYGFGPDDIFVVGNDGFVMHYDGNGWSRQPTSTDQRLWGVWGASPDAVWAVGGNGRAEGQQTLLKYDGEAWAEVAIPELERPQVRAFFKVWGTAADDVWVVGQRGVLLHWDGSEWTEHGAGTGRDLISLWGTGPDRIVAVGGRSNGVFAVWDGEGWESESLAPLPGFNGVWMRDADIAHVVGADGTILEIDVGTGEPTETSVETRRDFHAVFGDGEKLTAVGGNLSNPSGPFRGLAYERALGDGG